MHYYGDKLVDTQLGRPPRTGGGGGEEDVAPRMGDVDADPMRRSPQEMGGESVDLLKGHGATDAELRARGIEVLEVEPGRRVGEVEAGVPRERALVPYDAEFAARQMGDADPIARNWKGEPVDIPEGHQMSPRDPDFSEPPQLRFGPFTTDQRNAFVAGGPGDTHLEAHHRHQIPVADGGVIDELPGAGHPLGNVHRGGSPTRHPARSVFNAMEGGKALNRTETSAHYNAKGLRLVQTGPDQWIDPLALEYGGG